MAPLKAICLKTFRLRDASGSVGVFCEKGKTYNIVEYSEDLMTLELEKESCYQTTINDPDFLVHYEEDK
ncbi:glycosyltransferase [Bacillus phage Bcp1]|uniref:Uncharacterized protein n=1 Tax=Bacillus phage Bcp1 TaxID=584892 RepID=X2JL85_9CAUD|nr:glycosyltransferase [Bacillus phage Bcp1]AHN66595.1 hypothetical protein Bcp1_120 [Bacillus phage Bcp1]AXQ67787.1 hypothetical protein KIOSHI_127 [Bacillus phage Kioshi]